MTALCNTAINIANIESDKFARSHTQNRFKKFFADLFFVILEERTFSFVIWYGMKY